MNKKANELLTEQIIFYALNIIFIMLLLFFVWRAGTGAATAEESYAKRIGIAIDSIKPGTELVMDVSELYVYLEKNKMKSSPITVDYSKNVINIKVSSGTGYDFRYFTNLSSGSITINEKTKFLVIKS
jgi:hypothetical protein